MNIFRRDDHREGQGHAGVAEGIAEREEARARTRQSDHVAHSTVEGLQESFRQEEGKDKGTMVFICEGQSAAGSITSCRDVNDQAVFVLKGKPLNV